MVVSSEPIIDESLTGSTQLLFSGICLYNDNNGEVFEARLATTEGGGVGDVHFLTIQCFPILNDEINLILAMPGFWVHMAPQPLPKRE